MLHGVSGHANAGGLIVQEDELSLIECSGIVRDFARWREGEDVARGTEGFPGRFTAIRFPRGECVGARKLKRFAAREWEALDDIGYGREGRAGFAMVDTIERFFADPSNVPPTDTECRISRVGA
jgi:hypothetical protein